MSAAPDQEAGDGGPNPLLRATAFHYEKPDLAQDRTRAVRWIGRTPTAYAAVHILPKGKNAGITLHAHLQVDGYWVVLKGRVRFYTANDEVVGEFGPMEGMVTPRNFPYWFEQVGDEDAEMLQFEASDGPVPAFGEATILMAPRPANSHDFVDKADVYNEVSIP